MTISVIIRTLNESARLPELLKTLTSQVVEGDVEIILVDSGSNDGTLDIAEGFGVKILSISKEDFTFGRSLNVGCQAASGDYLAFISGHCVPADDYWLARLVKPLLQNLAGYSYGRQEGRDTTRFSEYLVFNKYYPQQSLIPQQGFYCNNANAMLRRDLWEQFRFNEQLTGLEDMYLAKQLVVAGHKVAYVSEASVYHIHNESWRQIKIRYQRESIALREIIPEVYLSVLDLLKCIVTSVFSDTLVMIKSGEYRKWFEIVSYRCCQYWGSFLGSNEHRKLTQEMKRRYFYPNDVVEEDLN